MSVPLNLLTTALYLFPIALLVWVRWSRDQPIAQIATLLPAAVAADLLVILLLARGLQLDAAIVLSRCLWGLAAALLVVRHLRRRLVRTAAAAARPTRTTILVLSCAALIGVALSVWLSRRYVIWDRNWHIPLVASLRGQRMPFMNVFQPEVRLGYHVAGDVLAGTLQTLSGVRLHSSVALSLAHDVMFGLTAICISALVSTRGQSRAWCVVSALAPLAVFLSGPPNVGYLGTGYSFFNFYQMSYRPHVVLAGLLIVGVLAALLRFLLAPGDGTAKLDLLSLLLTIALLGVTDEPSAIMLVPLVGLFLLLSRARLPRFGWLGVPAAMGVVLLLGWALLPSTLHGGPKLPTRIAAPVIPSFYQPILPLSTWPGLRALLVDVGSMMVLVLVLGVTALHRRRRELYTIFATGAALLGLSTFLLTCVVVADIPGESHRFMTLPEMTLPLLTLLVLPELPAAGRAVAAIALLVPAFFSARWAIDMQPELRLHYRSDSFSPGMRAVDCRAGAGSELFEKPEPTYASQRDWFIWSGCHPVFAPGLWGGTGTTVDVNGPIVQEAALSALARVFIDPDADLRVACALNDDSDRICRRLPASARCHESGSWRVCSLTAGERRALLRP